MSWSKKQYSILGIVATTSFLGTFLISSVNIALPAIEKDFGFDAVKLSWMVTAFLLANAMFLLPMGRMADLTGVRRIFKIGVVVFTITSFLCAWKLSGDFLLVLRFVQGIGASLTSTSGMAILVSSFKPQERGRVLGIAVSAVYLGLAIGPAAGGVITEYMGWQAIFWISALFGLATTIIAFIFLGIDEQKSGMKHHFDLKDSLVYMLGLSLLVYGTSLIPGWKGWLMMIGGVLGLLVFWFLQNRSKYPILETKLFTGNRLFAFSNLAALINYSATFAIIFLLSLFLQKVKGLSARDSGLILMAQPVMMAIFSPLSGRLSDRVQPRVLSTMGMAMCSIGLFIFGFISSQTHNWIIVGALIWVGLGFALFSSPNMNTIMSAVEMKQYGLASGTASTMRVIGQIVSMTVATVYLAIILKGSSIEGASNPQFLHAMKWTFLTLAVLSLVGIYFSYSRGKMDRS